jgi:hypothetical protein
MRGGNEEHVRLDDVVLGEQDVHGRDQDLAEPMRARERREDPCEVDHDPLVLQRRCRAHEMLAVDQLVAIEVVWKSEEVLVGHPRRRGASDHRASPFAVIRTLC